MSCPLSFSDRSGHGHRVHRGGQGDGRAAALGPRDAAGCGLIRRTPFCVQLSGVKVLQSMSFLSDSSLSCFSLTLGSSLSVFFGRFGRFGLLGLLNDDDKNDGIFHSEQQQQLSFIAIFSASGFLFPLRQQSINEQIA